MAPSDDGMVMVSFMVPAKDAEALTARAKREGRSRSDLIRDLLKNGLRGRTDQGTELRRLRTEIERLGGLVETALKGRR